MNCFKKAPDRRTILQIFLRIKRFAKSFYGNPIHHPTEKTSPKIRYHTSQISNYGKSGKPEKAQEMFDQCVRMEILKKERFQ